MAKWIVIICFLVAFAAGLTVGSQNRQPPGEARKTPDRCKGWLATELNLTPAQQDQLHRIWSETATVGGRDREERRRQLWQERDEAIAALIRPEDKARYEETISHYRDRMYALDNEWRSAFDSAVAQTKEILTPEQREKYDNILQRHRSERGRGRYRGGWGPRAPLTDPAATSPSAWGRDRRTNLN